MNACRVHHPRGVCHQQEAALPPDVLCLFGTVADHQTHHERPVSSCRRTCDHVSDPCGQKSCFEDYPLVGRQRVEEMNRRFRRVSFAWIALPGLLVLEILQVRLSFGVSPSRRGLCGDFRLPPACHYHGGGVLYPSLGLGLCATYRETCFACPCPDSLFHDSAYVCLRCLCLSPFVDLAGLASATGESAWCGGCQ